MVSVYGIYRAKNKKSEFIGIPEEISGATGISQDYVSKLAKSGRRTKTGWAITLVRMIERRDIAIDPDKEFLAENPEEDPILGTLDEISSLTGMELFTVRSLALCGIASSNGWTVIPVDGGGGDKNAVI